MKSSKVLCECLGVTEIRVAAAVRSGRACSVNEVMACTGAGTGCTACHKAIQAVVEQHSRPEPVARQQAS
ncbi:MAG TPA: (2Fe-2S)-binding protein [Planctomycetota bacterium]|nr:(2Fe-2S)-binding protein [Planctomycetota bacterium]